jgi:hypothetical protein
MSKPEVFVSMKAAFAVLLSSIPQPQEKEVQTLPLQGEALTRDRSKGMPL